MSIRDEIKAHITRKGKTLKFVHAELDQRHGTQTTYQNFVKKLARGTISYRDAKDIAEILGYEIDWKNK